MTDYVSNQHLAGKQRPLPVTITRGMRVLEVHDGTLGHIVGITQAFCIYRIVDGTALVVARWSDVALCDVCPAAPLLPREVTENDRQNARAAVLRELLVLQPLGLSEAEHQSLDELIAELVDA